MDPIRAWSIGFLLIVLGVATVLVGSSSSSLTVGGVILIGPLPIVFGTGPGSGLIMVVSLIAAILMVLVVYISIIVSRRARRPARVLFCIHLKSRLVGDG